MAKFEIFVGHQQWVSTNLDELAFIAQSWPENAQDDYYWTATRDYNRDGVTLAGNGPPEFITLLMALAQGHPILHGG